MGSNPTAAELAAIAAPFDRALADLATAEAAIRAIPGVGSIGDARCFMAEDLSCVTSQVAHARRNALRRAQGYVPPALLVAVADVPDPEPLGRRSRDPQATNRLPQPVPMPTRGALERGRR